MSGRKRFVVDVSDSDEEIGDSSPEKLASDAGEGTSSMLRRSRKKRKATTPLSYSAPSPKMFWSKNDELVILQGVIDYQKEKGVVYSYDYGAFVKFIKDDIGSKFSKDQVARKIRKMKAKFQENLVKEPTFTVAHDAKMFDLSLAIWGKDKVGSVDRNMVKVTMSKSKDKVGASVEHEGVVNDELENDDESDDDPSENVEKNLEDETGGKKSEGDEAVTKAKPKNDDGSAKANSWDGGEIPSDCVDKHVENETGGLENEDELCVLQGALEETMFQGLSESAQKLMLQNLRSIGAKERKELSDEWKALLVEEIKLKIKKQRFMAKFTDAV